MSNLTNQELRKLSLFYDKQLRKCHKESFAARDNNMEYFVTYLRYLRDYFLLAEPIELHKKNLKLSSIMAAVNEYDKFNSCITKYYKLDNDTITPISTDISESQVAEDYWKERNLHWGNFWQLVMLNIESWTANA